MCISLYAKCYLAAKKFVIKSFQRLVKKLTFIYQLYILRDPFLINVKRWFNDAGDDTLRLDYRLDETSIVFDVGGYLCDYADAIHKKFGCRVYVFEPVPLFYDKCVKRFSHNPSVTCFNYGLSSTSGWFEMRLDDNSSSFKTTEGGIIQEAQIRAISNVISELEITHIDLIKINIEGGEFDLLPAIINSGLINHIKYIQVQFHNFITHAVENRLAIRKLLEKTHHEMWNYEFVWESWELL